MKQHSDYHATAAYSPENGLPGRWITCKLESPAKASLVSCPAMLFCGSICNEPASQLWIVLRVHAGVFIRMNHDHQCDDSTRTITGQIAVACLCIARRITAGDSIPAAMAVRLQACARGCPALTCNPFVACCLPIEKLQALPFSQKTAVRTQGKY